MRAILLALLFLAVILVVSANENIFIHSVNDSNDFLNMRFDSAMRIRAAGSLGLRVGDQLQAVNGIDVQGWSEHQISYLLQQQLAFSSAPLMLAFARENMSCPMDVPLPGGGGGGGGANTKGLLNKRVAVLVGDKETGAGRGGGGGGQRGRGDVMVAVLKTHSETSHNIAAAPLRILDASLAVFSSNVSAACEYLPVMLASPLDGCSLSSVAADNMHSARNSRYRGHFVLVSRGVCSFFAKAMHVKAGGGAGMLVVNSEDTHFAMPAEDPAAGTVVGLPVLMLARQAGDRLAEEVRDAGRQNARVDTGTRIKVRLSGSSGGDVTSTCGYRETRRSDAGSGVRDKSVSSVTSVRSAESDVDSDEELIIEEGHVNARGELLHHVIHDSNDDVGRGGGEGGELVQPQPQPLYDYRSDGELRR